MERTTANQKTTSSYFADADATLDRRGRLQQSSVYTSATAHLDTRYDNYDIFGTGIRGGEEWLPGLMSQSAVVRDYRVLETGRRRANRLVLTVVG